ncbi:hypothetical protein CNMCM6069_001119 [Aspergillus lentulus]|nr:hypothetical protein CNMCM6069_001119 [Aspergillus lentulus]
MLFQNLVSQLFLLLLSCSPVFTVPVNVPGGGADLIARAGNNGKGTSKSNPKDATFDVTGWEDIAEEDCYVMLCLKNGERTWQRNPTPGLNKVHYQKSGAAAKPFQKGNVPKRHTGQINPQPGERTETNSAEEFPWESMSQGGSNADLLPATRHEQKLQGAAIRKGFQTSDIDLGEWFKITFTGNLGPICQALHRDPPDESICKKPEVSLFGKKINLNDWVWYMAKVGGSLAYYHAAGSSKDKIGKRMTLIEVPNYNNDGDRFMENRADGFTNGDNPPIVDLHQDFKLDGLVARAEHYTNGKPASLQGFDRDLENMELTEEDLEIIKP